MFNGIRRQLLDPLQRGLGTPKHGFPVAVRLATDERISACEFRPGLDEPGVQFDRALHVRDELGLPEVAPKAPGGPFVGAVGRHVAGWYHGQVARFVLGQFCVEGRTDGACNVRLHIEKVGRGQGAVEGLGPQVLIRAGIDQLGVDPNLVAGDAHKSFQDHGGAEFLADPPDVSRRVAVGHDGTPGNHPQRTQA